VLALLAAGAFAWALYVNPLATGLSLGGAILAGAGGLLLVYRPRPPVAAAADEPTHPGLERLADFYRPLAEKERGPDEADQIYAQLSAQPPVASAPAQDSSAASPAAAATSAAAPAPSPAPTRAARRRTTERAARRRHVAPPPPVPAPAAEPSAVGELVSDEGVAPEMPAPEVQSPPAEQPPEIVEEDEDQIRRE
jgi:hypothetical protein